MTRKQQRSLLMTFFDAGSISNWLQRSGGGLFVHPWRRELAQQIIDQGYDSISALPHDERDKLMAMCIEHQSAEDPMHLSAYQLDLLKSPVVVETPAQKRTRPMTYHERDVAALTGLGKRSS